MSFSWKVKEEISTILPRTKNCCLYSYLYGMVFPALLKEGKYIIKTTFVENASQLHNKLSNLLIKSPNAYTHNKREILITSGVIRYSTFAEIENNIFKCSSCREHFFKGLFLACASISSPEKAYRLDLTFSNFEHAYEIKKALYEMGINLNQTLRNNKVVLYAKKEETIKDFLALIGANNSTFEILNIKINNEIRNDANRATNCDSANINKSLNASLKYIEAINYLKEKKHFDVLPVSLQEISNARIENPDINISELGKKLSPPISKSGVHHRLEKILKISEELKKK